MGHIRQSRLLVFKLYLHSESDPKWQRLQGRYALTKDALTSPNGEVSASRMGQRRKDVATKGAPTLPFKEEYA